MGVENVLEEDIKMKNWLTEQTDMLIRESGFHISAERDFSLPGGPLKSAEFLQFLIAHLRAKAVGKMSSENLHKYQDSFRHSDLRVSTIEFIVQMNNRSFSDVTDIIRTVVAIYLAYIIRDRLDPKSMHESFPAYKP